MTRLPQTNPIIAGSGEEIVGKLRRKGTPYAEPFDGPVITPFANPDGPEAADFIEAQQARERVLVEALEKQGLALAAFVNLLCPRVVETMLDTIITDEHDWKRAPTKAEIQAALEAQNNAVHALSKARSA